MKKLLLLFFVFCVSFSFAQQTESEKNMDSGKKSDSITLTSATLTSVSAYPNPFSSKTQISFKSSKNQQIEFNIKNLLGTTIYKELLTAKVGQNVLPFMKDNLTKGMYIYILKSENEIVSKRLVIR